MSVCVQSSIVLGIDAYPVLFEIAVAPGPARFSITGLPKDTAKESQSRIGKAIRSSGFLFPYDRSVTCNFQAYEVSGEAVEHFQAASLKEDSSTTCTEKTRQLLSVSPSIYHMPEARF
jgi:hypothetical protein